MSYKNTKLLLPFAGSDTDTTISDISAAKIGDFTAGDTAEISVDQSKFYGVSGKFADSSGNHFSRSHSGEIDIGDGDFTIEGWVRLNTVPASNYGVLFIGDISSNNNRVQVDVNSSMETVLFVATTSTVGFGARMGTLSTDTWHHLAFCRSGSSYKSFLDGTQGSSETNAGELPPGSDMPNIYLGAARAGGVQINLDGFLQDWRIVVGEALYTSNFTPPSQLAHTYAGTVKDGSDNPLQRSVHIHERDSGVLVAETDSDSNGDWSALGANLEAYGVALGSSGDNENAAVLDRIAVT